MAKKVITGWIDSIWTAKDFMQLVRDSPPMYDIMGVVYKRKKDLAHFNGRVRKIRITVADA